MSKLATTISIACLISFVVVGCQNQATLTSRQDRRQFQKVDERRAEIVPSELEQTGPSASNAYMWRYLVQEDVDIGPGGFTFELCEHSGPMYDLSMELETVDGVDISTVVLSAMYRTPLGRVIKLIENPEVKGSQRSFHVAGEYGAGLKRTFSIKVRSITVQSSHPVRLKKMWWGWSGF